jgi:hypothetical protein
MKDHEKLLRDVLRVRFQSLVDKFKESESGMIARINEMGIEQFITDTKAIADKFPCLWDLVTEMESDLMSEVTK